MHQGFMYLTFKIELIWNIENIQLDLRIFSQKPKYPNPTILILCLILFQSFYSKIRQILKFCKFSCKCKAEVKHFTLL